VEAGSREENASKQKAKARQFGFRPLLYGLAALSGSAG
jgi:hypothetical protein